MEIDPNNTFVLRKHGKFYHYMGRHEEALVDLNKSLEIESNNAWIITSHHMIDKYEEALVYFNKSLKIEPNDAFELRNRGATFRVLGRYDEWLAELKKPLEIEEETFLKKSKYEEALADLNKSLKIESNNADALRIRGEIYYIMNKYQESLSDLNQSLEIEPTNAFALSAYRVMKKYDEDLRI